MDDIRKSIELVGKQTLVIKCSSPLENPKLPDNEQLVPCYIECDDVLLDGESVREKDAVKPGYDTMWFPASKAEKERGWRLLNPARKVRIPFLIGEFAEIVEASDSPMTEREDRMDEGKQKTTTLPEVLDAVRQTIDEALKNKVNTTHMQVLPNGRGGDYTINIEVHVPAYQGPEAMKEFKEYQRLRALFENHRPMWHPDLKG